MESQNMNTSISTQDEHDDSGFKHDITEIPSLEMHNFKIVRLHV